MLSVTDSLAPRSGERVGVRGYWVCEQTENREVGEGLRFAALTLLGMQAVSPRMALSATFSLEGEGGCVETEWSSV